MFDIDGTLIESCGFDSDCYFEAVKYVTGFELNTDWALYKNITDSGILDEFLKMKGLREERELLHKQVREKFTQLISKHLKKNPVCEVDGAIDFLKQLQLKNDVEIAIATGGWGDTAKAKLNSAGFNISGVAFASSLDHFERTNVMKMAESRCNNQSFVSKTYFGDGSWDKKASEELSYNFVLVGNKLQYSKQVESFRDSHSVLSLIGI